MRRQGAARAEVERPGGSPTAPTASAPYGVSGATLVVFLVLGLWTPAWAGGPDPSQYPNMKQQYVSDVAQTVSEQDVPRGDLIKALVLDAIEDIGYFKALIWLAMLPFLTLIGVVFGAIKLFKRKG